MYLAFSFANCIHRAPPVIFRGTFLITNPRFRGRFSSSLFTSASAFFLLRIYLSPSLFFSLFSSFVPAVVAEKSFSQRRRKRVAQSADYIVKYTQRRNYAAVDLCVGCLLRTAFYGCLIKLRSNYRSTNY